MCFLSTIFPNAPAHPSLYFLTSPLGPLTTLQFARIELDSVRQEARLPSEKIHKCSALLHQFAQKRSVTLRKLQSLIGLLREGPLENLCGGGQSTKKYSRRGKLKEKNSCTPINPKKYSCYGLKKNSYKEFDNGKKFLLLENFLSPPPPITFLMVRS